MYYILETINPAGNLYTHSCFVSADTEPQVRLVDTVRGPDGRQQYLYNFGDDQYRNSSEYVYYPNVNKWICAEWHVNSETNVHEFLR